MERFLASLVSIIIGLTLFPIVMILGIWGSVKLGNGSNLGVLSALAAGLAVAVFVVWKAPRLLRIGLDRIRSKAPEPFYSCLAGGVAAALSIATLMTVPIFLLGHTRPEGWELDSVSPFMAGAFVLGAAFGARLGLERRREGKSRGNPPIS